MSIKIIGVTGPSGAGKSCLSSHLAKKGIPTIDADAVYHSLLVKDSDCTKALVAEFGLDILDDNGAPDTKKLREIVFSSEEKLKKLNSIVLKIVIVEIKKIIKAFENSKNGHVIVDAPTLIESGFSNECDHVISVLADKEKRIERICERDGLSYEKALMRVSAQKNDEFYKSNSDYILTNNGDAENFISQVDHLFNKILSN